MVVVRNQASTAIIAGQLQFDASVLKSDGVKLHFSPATVADVAELVRLVNSAYRGESSRKGWTTEADLLDGVRTSEACMANLISEPHVTILKCEATAPLTEVGLLGCVCLEQHGPSSVYVGMLTVHPEAQSLGIGKKMLAAAEDYARTQLECTKSTMTVISVRHELIAFYERRGYQRTGETKPFPMDDPRFGLPKQHLEFIVMEKVL